MANVHDIKTAIILMKTLKYLLILPQITLVDGGYRANMIEGIKTTSIMLFR